MKHPKEMLEEIGSTLLASDSRFTRTVIIISADFGAQIYTHAFVLRYHQYYLIFTEHHGYAYEHKDNVLSCRQFDKQINIETAI